MVDSVAFYEINDTRERGLIIPPYIVCRADRWQAKVFVVEGEKSEFRVLAHSQKDAEAIIGDDGSEIAAEIAQMEEEVEDLQRSIKEKRREFRKKTGREYD